MRINNSMPLLAKAVIKNKFWIIEDSGTQVATILASPTGVTLVQDGTRENFASLKLLSDRHNIIFDKAKQQKVIKDSSFKVYGYPSAFKVYHTLWDVKKKVPVFTKTLNSKSFYCAGYYIIQFNNGWLKSYCPKLITLNRYPFKGPYKTQEEMQEHLRNANREFYGTT
jgi:hypothetical protein